MSYEFSLNHHGDVCLNLEDNLVNFGYNTTSEMPVMMWLFHFQLGNGNLFDRFGVNWDFGYSSDAEEVVEKAREIQEQLPLPVKEFNWECERERFAYHLSGSNRSDSSKVFLLEEMDLVLRPWRYRGKAEEIMKLNLEQAEEYTLDYFSFVKKESSIPAVRRDVGYVVDALKSQ